MYKVLVGILFGLGVICYALGYYFKKKGNAEIANIMDKIGWIFISAELAVVAYHTCMTA